MQPGVPDTMSVIDTSVARRPSTVEPCAVPSPTFDPLARGSFSSIRETDDGLVQTFTRSKISSYAEALEEEAIVDSTDESPVYHPPLTQPSSRLHRFLYPADSFRGWREIPLAGRRASRSCDNIQRLLMTWDSNPAAAAPVSPPVEKSKPVIVPGRSPIESLPYEVISAIIELLVVEIPPHGLTKRNADLMSLLLTSKSLHGSTLATLYRNITIPHSRIYRKFLSTITKYPSLATIIRRLDFSHFNPSMLFTSASERAMTKNLTSETLLQCLQMTPLLREFLAQEYIDGDISVEVLSHLLFNLPKLQALDFCGSTAHSFRRTWEEVVEEKTWPEELPITRLSLHKCMGLPPSVFETILPRLKRLTHLDVAATRITRAALLSIPCSARLTHLNLAKCSYFSSDTAIDFLSKHPAARTLVYLSLATDTSSQALLDEAAVTKLLPILPPTLRSLSLKGSRMDATHIPQLKRLSETLEELSVGRGLTMDGVCQLFYKDMNNSKPRKHSLISLDMSDMNVPITSFTPLLSPATYPLRVIEVDKQPLNWVTLAKTIERVGWTTKEIGHRYWLVRMKPAGPNLDHDRRWWKHGAESWGMRKIPVASAEVGGMYGSFMFGRRV